MPRFEAVLLDYGNTIIEFDTPQMDLVLRGLVAAYGPIVGDVDVNLLREAMYEVIAMPSSGDPPEYRELPPHTEVELLLEKCWGAELDVTPELVERCNRILQDLFVESVVAEPGTQEVLGKLSEHCRVGLVSNYPCGDAIRRSLKKVGIHDYFDPIVVSGEVGYVKPHPLIFSTALDALEVKPHEVLFVGDRWDADILGASQAGMETCHHVGFTSDMGWKEKYGTCEPNFSITCLSQLTAIVVDGDEQAHRPAGPPV